MYRITCMDGHEMSISHEDIEEETSVSALMEWLYDVDVPLKELEDMVSAFRDGGTENRDLCYKLGRYRCFRSAVKRRINDLAEEARPA